jgi:hypothetical protein
MPLSVGTRLGPYEILAPLAPVAWVRFTGRPRHKLKRDVALKVLPEAFAFLVAIPVESFSERLIHLTVNWLAGGKK